MPDPDTPTTIGPGSPRWPEFLSDLAEATGGRFYREENLYELVEKVESKKAPFLMRREVLLWGRLSLLVLVLLLTAEWTVRKFSNLS